MSFSLSPPRRVAAAAALCLVLAGLPAQAQLPSLGDAGDLSTAAERKMGLRIARELYRDPDYIDDPVIVEYVAGIWQKLLAAARARGELTGDLDQRFAWEVLLGKDRTINAFAVPGGWLGLHLGLVSVTSNRDELASVLAHELSHVTQRHISRMMEAEGRQMPLMIAAMVLGAIALGKSPEAGGALITGGQALAAQQSLNFSRDMEREADRIGFGVATQAGFAPQGFVGMFEKLQQAARLNDNGAFPYLRTHPMTTERMAEMQSRQQLAGATPPQATMEHVLVAARARVLSNSGVDALRGMVSEAEASTLAAQPKLKQAASLYAATFAASKLRDFAQANRLLARLDTATTGDAAGARLTRLLEAEIALAARDPAHTLRVVDPATSSAHRPELLLAAQAQVQTGQAKDVAQRLQAWVSTHPRDATAWEMLSSAYAAQGQQLRAVRADAEAQAAQLDYKAALDRLKAAQDLVRRGQGGGDYIEASIVDTRTREVESLVREQTLER